jgi:hypothetical protein
VQIFQREAEGAERRGPSASPPRACQVALADQGAPPSTPRHPVPRVRLVSAVVRRGPGGVGTLWRRCGRTALALLPLSGRKNLFSQEFFTLSPEGPKSMHGAIASPYRNSSGQLISEAAIGHGGKDCKADSADAQLITARRDRLRIGMRRPKSSCSIVHERAQLRCVDELSRNVQVLCFCPPCRVPSA